MDVGEKCKNTRVYLEMEKNGLTTIGIRGTGCRKCRYKYYRVKSCDAVKKGSGCFTEQGGCHLENYFLPGSAANAEVEEVEVKDEEI